MISIFLASASSRNQFVFNFASVPFLISTHRCLSLLDFVSVPVSVFALFTVLCLLSVLFLFFVPVPTSIHVPMSLSLFFPPVPYPCLRSSSSPSPYLFCPFPVLLYSYLLLLLIPSHSFFSYPCVVSPRALPLSLCLGAVPDVRLVSPRCVWSRLVSSRLVLSRPLIKVLRQHTEPSACRRRASSKSSLISFNPLLLLSH